MKMSGLKLEKNTNKIYFSSIHKLILENKGKKYKTTNYKLGLKILQFYKDNYFCFIKEKNLINQFELFEEELKYRIFYFINTYTKVNKALNLNINDKININIFKKKNFKISDRFFIKSKDQIKLIQFILLSHNKDYILKNDIIDPDIKYINSSINFYLLINIFYITISKFILKVKYLKILDFFNLDQILLINSRQKVFKSIFKKPIKYFNPSLEFKNFENLQSNFIKFVFKNKIKNKDKNLNLFIRCSIFATLNITSDFFSNSFYDHNFNKILSTLNKINHKEIILHGGEFKKDNILILRVAKKLKKVCYYYQNGGRQLSEIGHSENIDDFPKYNYFNKVYLYAYSLKLKNKSNKISYINDINLSNIKILDKKNFNKKKIKILYAPLSLNDYIYSIEPSIGINSYEINDHNDFIIKNFNSLLDIKDFEFEIYIKLKSNYFYDGYKYLLTPNINKFKTYFITKYDSVNYFRYFDLFITSGGSTTLINSLYSNMPTIYFYDHKTFSIKKNFLPLYNQLFKNKIIVTNPNNFKDSVLANLKNYNWYKSKNQKIVKEYLKVFAFNINNKY